MKQKFKGKVNKNNKTMEDFKMTTKSKQVDKLNKNTMASYTKMSNYTTIISNRDAVQENLMEILFSFWEKCGFDISFINDYGYLEYLYKLVFDKDFMYGYAEDLMSGDSEASDWMKIMSETFVSVLDCTSDDIKEFNESASIDEKRSTFIQVLWLISYLNRYNRIGLMDILATAPKKIECEEGKQRANLLGNMLWKPLL